MTKTRPSPLVHEAERSVAEARARLRSACAFLAFAAAGDARRAGQIKARMAGGKSTDTRPMARRFPELNSPENGA